MAEDKETKIIQDLENKIKQAQLNNEPIEEFVMKEVEWLQSQLDLFLQIEIAKGKDISTDIDIAEIEIRQYATMKKLLEKINKPTDKYDKRIKEIQCRIFGEENYKIFFGNQ